MYDLTSACCQVMKSEICFASCQNFSKLISPLGSLLEQPSFRKYKSFTNKLKNGMMIWKEKKSLLGVVFHKTHFFLIHHIILSNILPRSEVKPHLFFFAACLCTLRPPHSCLQTWTIDSKVTCGVHLVLQDLKFGSVHFWPL